jgi:hypothetical protein
MCSFTGYIRVLGCCFWLLVVVVVVVVVLRDSSSLSHPDPATVRVYEVGWVGCVITISEPTGRALRISQIKWCAYGSKEHRNRVRSSVGDGVQPVPRQRTVNVTSWLQNHTGCSTCRHSCISDDRQMARLNVTLTARLPRTASPLTCEDQATPAAEIKFMSSWELYFT